MKKEFSSVEEAKMFIDELAEKKEFVINSMPNKDGKIEVEWQEHKKYTARDGQTFYDEVWITKDNQMLQIQDIDAEHCRNIIRMMLRQERAARAAVDILAAQLAESFAGTFDEPDEDDFFPDANHPPVGSSLH
jgi:primase-polymerase (primpol)-like protein